jgi:hypothetical protein
MEYTFNNQIIVNAYQICIEWNKGSTNKYFLNLKQDFIWFEGK